MVAAHSNKLSYSPVPHQPEWHRRSEARHELRSPYRFAKSVLPCDDPELRLVTIAARVDYTHVCKGDPLGSLRMPAYTNCENVGTQLAAG